MSYDPYAAGSELPPEPDPAAQPSGAIRARQRVQAPAISLIVIGILNLLLAAIPAYVGIGVSRVPPEQWEEEMKKQDPKRLEDLQALGWNLTKFRNVFVYGSLALAAADFLASFLVILGGIRMLALKNYGLAIVAAIFSALPGLSCSGCCGVGAVIGIWALIVLLDAEVHAAFQ